MLEPKKISGGKRYTDSIAKNTEIRRPGEVGPFEGHAPGQELSWFLNFCFQASVYLKKAITPQARIVFPRREKPWGDIP